MQKIAQKEKDRKEKYKILIKKMEEIANKYGEKIIALNNNKISILFTLGKIVEKSGNKDAKEIGSMCFNRQISGMRDIINQRDDLEKKSASLSVQLKTEYELKDVYESKISSLTMLLDNLKIEYNKLIEQNGGENPDKSDIKSSKIVNSVEAFEIAKKIKGTIADKCFDGPENNYSPQKFHEKCDKSALLILMKTDDNKRLGAFIKVSSDGLEIKKDLDSCLINIDENKYFYVASTEYITIICDPNELPQIGIDFQIKKNGKALNMFPFHYGKNTDSNKDFYKSNNINIQNMEIYKVTF